MFTRIRSVKPPNVRRVVKVLGMLNAGPDFKKHPKVIDGFSDLMVEVFGCSGRGARRTRHDVAFKAGSCRNRNGFRSEMTRAQILRRARINLAWVHAAFTIASKP